ncbi:hypothetical protein [uncultured Psychroserpens sp.]|uniref:hypothetical protein n=1 Tax=uncultured Psychroserpens sp. TaxID=255436 RepID=UPI002625F330|nr:hypothetical protein [uncultured Psychroserpens sp.]
MLDLRYKLDHNATKSAIKNLSSFELTKELISNELFYGEVEIYCKACNKIEFKAFLFQFLDGFLGGLKVLKNDLKPEKFKDAEIGVFDYRYNEYDFSILKKEDVIQIRDENTACEFETKFQHLWKLFTNTKANLIADVLEVYPQFSNNDYFKTNPNTNLTSL